MSLASYMGCNQEIPINADDSDDFFILAVVLPVSVTC